MESPQTPDEAANFETAIKRYKSIFFELSKDPLTAAEETIATFEELTKYVHEQFHHNPTNWDHYSQSIVEEFGPDFAQKIYIEVCRINERN